MGPDDALENVSKGVDDADDLNGYDDFDEFDDLDEYDDLDDEAYLAAWDEAALDAAGVLLAALPQEAGTPPPEPDLSEAAQALRRGVESGTWPFDVIARANGWLEEPVPESDTDVVLWAAGALLIMEEDPGLEAEDEAGVLALEFADWIGAVLGLVRRGPGADASPHTLISYIRTCPELDGDILEEDEFLIEAAFSTVQPCWDAARVIDSDERVTRLGVWVLPRMLALAWGVDLDNP